MTAGTSASAVRARPTRCSTPRSRRRAAAKPKAGHPAPNRAPVGRLACENPPTRGRMPNPVATAAPTTEVDAPLALAAAVLTPP